MSLIKLQGNASGTGAFTIAAPNGNTDRTLTLPDATGTVNVSGLANEVPAGSAGAPAIYPTGDTNTGIFFPAADTIAFAEGGVEAMRIDSSGNMQVGVTSSVDAARLTVRSAQTDFSGSALRVQNGNQTNLFYVQNDGNINAGAISTSTGTSLVMTASGFIVKSSSSLRYKKDVEPIDIGLDFVLGLQPVKYNLKDGNAPQVGFIAEDFPDTRLVSESLIDIDDPSKGLQREGVNYANLVAPLVKAVQEQQAQIEDLKAEVAALKGASA